VRAGSAVAQRRPDGADAGPLRFGSPDDPGIARIRSGRGFRYEDPDGRPVRDEEVLARIRRIAIPPAWTEVWISPHPNSHLQAVGRDARGRRQYRYHPRFRARRDRDKFARLARFGKVLPRIRRRVRADLAARGLPRQKVLAVVVALLDSTHLRVGNAEYARLNRSFGLSTLRRRHATVEGASIEFRFRGKGGRIEERRLVDRRLAAVVRRCQELSGQALFQYPDAEDPDVVRGVSSEDVNDYLREAAGDETFSAKDFRTWAATLLAFRRMGEAKAAVTQTAEDLGDTPTVTRNSYIHPAVLDGIDEAPPAPKEAPDSGPRNLPDPTRRDELALLAFLRGRRAAGAAVRDASATRPKAGARRSGARSGRPAA
jgi:DNA topoisomerase-1